MPYLRGFPLVGSFTPASVWAAPNELPSHWTRDRFDSVSGRPGQRIRVTQLITVAAMPVTESIGASNCCGIFMRLRLALTGLWVLLSAACSSSIPAEHLRVVREVPLSQHSVNPYVIRPAQDGGYVVTGSEGMDDARGWAARYDAAGNQLWEFLDGSPVSGLHRFNGAVVLPDGRTLLCGIEAVPHEFTRAHLVILDGHGAVSAEQDIYPEGNPANYNAEFNQCTRWGDGVAVLGSAGRGAENHGWLVMLDLTGDVSWERFIPCAGARDVLETVDHELLVLSLDTIDARNSRLDRLSTGGFVVNTRHMSGEARFIRPYSSGSTISVMTDEEPDGPTQLWQLNDSLDGSYKDVKKPIDLGRFIPKTGYELADKSTVLFGGVLSGGWTAAVMRTFSNSGWNELPLEPPHASYWFNEAAPTGRQGEFATVRRRADFRGVLAWVSIEK